MEETNPWLDPDSGKHKNKKSVKPKPKEYKEEAVNTSNIQDEKFVPGAKKGNNDKHLNFLNTLVTDSLDPVLPDDVRKWAIENFDNEWVETFVSDITLVKKDILSSKFLPSERTLLLLKLIFLLRQGY